MGILKLSCSSFPPISFLMWIWVEVIPWLLNAVTAACTGVTLEQRKAELGVEDRAEGQELQSVKYNCKIK